MGAPCCSRSCRIWRAITSRKVWPSFTSSSDFAFVMPMLVPSPPFSLSTTTRSIADASPSPSSESEGTSSSGSISLSGTSPCSPARRRSS